MTTNNVNLSIMQNICKHFYNWCKLQQRRMTIKIPRYIAFDVWTTTSYTCIKPRIAMI